MPNPTITVVTATRAEYGLLRPVIQKLAASKTLTLQLVVTGNERQTMVTALFDNLGKGASGAAVQNMNLMLGFRETEGLNLDDQ